MSAKPRIPRVRIIKSTDSWFKDHEVVVTIGGVKFFSDSLHTNDPESAARDQDRANKALQALLKPRMQEPAEDRWWCSG